MELAGDVAALVLLHLDETARERLHPPRRGLHLLEEDRILDRQIAGLLGLL